MYIYNFSASGINYSYNYSIYGIEKNSTLVNNVRIFDCNLYMLLNIEEYDKYNGAKYLKGTKSSIFKFDPKGKFAVSDIFSDTPTVITYPNPAADYVNIVSSERINGICMD